MNQVATSQFVNVNRPPAALLVHPSHDNHALTAARKWDACAGIVAHLTPKNGLPARRAQLHFSFGWLPDPSAPWGARFWEVESPTEVKPVEWLLTSQMPLTCVGDALHLLHVTPDLVTATSCT